MKQVVVTLKFVISDSKLKMNSNAEELSVDYLEKHGTRVLKTGEIQQLYNVQVPTTQMYFEDSVKKGDRTREGFLACYGQKNNYTRGQAIMKARVFEGKVVKCVD